MKKDSLDNAISDATSKNLNAFSLVLLNKIQPDESHLSNSLNSPPLNLIKNESSAERYDIVQESLINRSSLLDKDFHRDISEGIASDMQSEKIISNLDTPALSIPSVNTSALNSRIQSSSGREDLRGLSSIKIQSSLVSLFSSQLNSESEERYLDHRSSMGSSILHLSIIIETIGRKYIEELIIELNLLKVVEEAIGSLLQSTAARKSQVIQKDLIGLIYSIDISKIQEFIYEIILNEFLSQQWLSSLVSNLITNRVSTEKIVMMNPDLLKRTLTGRIEEIEEIEDNTLEVFTPGVHSPNAVLSRIDSVSESNDKFSVYSEKTGKAVYESPGQKIENFEYIK